MTAAFSRASHSSRIGGEAETKLSLISPDWISLDGKTWSIANPFLYSGFDDSGSASTICLTQRRATTFDSNKLSFPGRAIRYRSLFGHRKHFAAPVEGFCESSGGSGARLVICRGAGPVLQRQEIVAFIMRDHLQAEIRWFEALDSTRCSLKRGKAA